MMDIEDATRKLDSMLAASSLPKRSSYTRREVCRILGISERTFWRYVANYEPSSVDKTNVSREPWMLDSYMTRGHYRVPYSELVAFIDRNRTWNRQNAY